MGTGIEWTDETWNPTTGCDRVSPGCDNCYALGMAKRLKAMGQPDYQTDGDPKTSGPGFGLAIHPHRLDQPLRWKKPRKVFVNSMSDLFHADVPTSHLVQVFAVMALSPQHTFQILTKRHARMRSLLDSMEFWRSVSYAASDRSGEDVDLGPVLPNVWLGVSVEDQKWADIRIPFLLGTPAARRFLSCEPLLSAVDLTNHLHVRPIGENLADWPLSPAGAEACGLPALHWVIAGGESGPGSRPMHPDWARSLRDQCAAAKIPFHFKQFGNWAPLAPADAAAGDVVLHRDGKYFPLQASRFEGIEIERRREMYVLRNVGKKKAGRELDGRTHDEFPEVVAV